MVRSIPVLPVPGKSIILPSRYISIAISNLLQTLIGYETSFSNWIPDSKFAYSATVKSRPSAKYIGIKR